MTLRVRRVVTGLDAKGKAVVADDRVLPVATRRPGQSGCNVWAVDELPAELAAPDRAADLVGSTIPNGAVFRVVRYEAGTSGRMHRTRSVDCGVVLSGSIALELDDGAEVALDAGDVLVQRGTIHNWINRGTEPCTIAFVLLGARTDPTIEEQSS
jgi:quercetin dioxygenase-like cupin family protein